jgi:hypothetical protein
MSLAYFDLRLTTYDLRLTTYDLRLTGVASTGADGSHDDNGKNYEDRNDEDGGPLGILAAKLQLQAVRGALEPLCRH